MTFFANHSDHCVCCRELCEHLSSPVTASTIENKLDFVQKLTLPISPSSIYSWSIGHILEHEFFSLSHLGCAGSKEKSGFEFF